MGNSRDNQWSSTPTRLAEGPRLGRAQYTGCTLTNETEASNRDIEHEERVHSNTHPVPNNPRAAQDADTCSQRPCHENEVNWYSGNCGKTECAEKCGDNEWEERVTDDADRLEEGAVEVPLV
jgi:hypothetical protein